MKANKNFNLEEMKSREVIRMTANTRLGLLSLNFFERQLTVYNKNNILWWGL